MGCTPSKQVNVAKESNEEQEGGESEGVNEISFKENDNVIAANGTKTDQNGKKDTHKQKSGAKGSQNVGSDKRPDAARYRMQQASKGDKKFTQSQLDFFEMLDRKIESGPDYVSEDERSKVWNS